MLESSRPNELFVFHAEKDILEAPVSYIHRYATELLERIILLVSVVIVFDGFL